MSGSRRGCLARRRCEPTAARYGGSRCWRRSHRARTALEPSIGNGSFECQSLLDRERKDASIGQDAGYKRGSTPPRLRPASQAAVLRRTRSKPRRAEETSRVAYQHQRRAQRAGTPAALSEAPPIEGERVARARGRDPQPSPLERVPLCARRALCAGAGEESAPATRKQNLRCPVALLSRMDRGCGTPELFATEAIGQERNTGSLRDPRSRDPRSLRHAPLATVSGSVEGSVR
jgi:hypothetical protein